jgi:hypothetical protein
MGVKIYTLGYAQQGSAERLQTLMHDPSMLLIDARMHPRTSYQPWDGHTLKAVWGRRYHWAGRYLGNINYKGGPINIVDIDTGVHGLGRYHDEGHSQVIICGCKNYDECHRSHIVEALHKARPDIEIVLEEPPSEVQEKPSKGDVVVTVPLSFGLDRWIEEGDPVGEKWSGEEWHFYLSGPRPKIQAGDRVYVIYNGVLRGYAPLVRIDATDNGGYGLVRHGNAQAVTIPEYIRGFKGWRYRWWDRSQEVSFPNWQDPEALPAGVTRPAPSKKKTHDEQAIEQGMRNIAHAFGISPQSFYRDFEDIG